MLRPLMLLLALLAGAQAVCRLPPDFWCDSPEVAKQCTGSTDFCAGFARNQKDRPFRLDLAFEAACPDSRQFVQRIFPKLLSQPFIYEHVDFQPVPWGLAKVEAEGKVKCHHGPRECTGNRLLTCLMEHAKEDLELRDRVFHCFMSKMEDRESDVLRNMQQCFYQTRSAHLYSTVLACANSAEATRMQKEDEQKTRAILSKPRFVPYLSLNGHAHHHLQAFMMLLPEKVRAWSYNVQNFPLTSSAARSACRSPPDLWCSTPAITAQCFHAAGCAQYMQAIYGQPVGLKLFYRPGAPNARAFVRHYVQKHFLDADKARTENNTNKFVLELTPVLDGGAECRSSGAGCASEALLECVLGRVGGLSERNRLLACLLEGGTDARWAWSRCQAGLSPVLVQSVEQCAASPEWTQLSARRAAAEHTARADMGRRGYWITVNGFGTFTMQGYAHNLHRLVCLWYRGPGHDRDKCLRCDYEPTHCF